MPEKLLLYEAHTPQMSAAEYKHRPESGLLQIHAGFAKNHFHRYYNAT